MYIGLWQNSVGSTGKCWLILKSNDENKIDESDVNRKSEDILTARAKTYRQLSNGENLMKMVRIL